MKIINNGNGELEFNIKPFTGWFFATAQLILGLCFLYIYTVPGSSKDMSLLIGLGSLGLFVYTFLSSFISSITFNKQLDRLTVIKSNFF